MTTCNCMNPRCWKVGRCLAQYPEIDTASQATEIQNLRDEVRRLGDALDAQQREPS